MEERHWWFAARLQDTFHFGGYEGPSLLEDFLSDPEVIDLINAFLGPGEPRRLFFYCEEEEGQARSGAASGGSRRLRAVSEIDAEALARAAGKVCLYAVRGDTEGEVEQMEREVFCGELRHSVLSSLASLLSDAYSPLLRRQSHWGECSDSAVAGFLENFQRQSSALAEEAGIAQSRRGVLERPPTELQTLQQQQGKAVLTAETVGDCEELVRDWTNCIDSLLLDTTDERMENPWTGPMTELGKWRQRLCLLTAVVEQLKAKEMRAVFGVLITARSRALKKWRTTDSQLTDAFNSARDRVRYLETLSPHLEALEGTPSLSSLLSSILPAIMTSIKQMEGLSRGFARSGYLGILLTKISNALVRICTANLKTYCRGEEGTDQFWDILNSVVEQKMKPGQANDEHPFLTRLSLCHQVALQFTDSLHHLREVLVAQPRVNFSTHSPSIGRSAVSLLGGKRTNALSSSTISGGGKEERSGSKTLTVPGSGLPAISPFALSGGSDSTAATPTGVGLHEVAGITAGLKELSFRVTQVMEMVSSLFQFRSLTGNLRGLPRVSGLWTADPPLVVLSSQGSLEGTNERGDPIPEGSVRASDYLEQVFGRRDYPLPSLENEGREKETEKEEEKEGQKDREKKRDSLSDPDEECGPKPPVPGSTAPDSPLPGPTDSIATHICSKLATITTSLSSACPHGASDVFCVRGKASSAFPTAHDVYTSHVSSLEKDIAAYLRDVVPKVSTSKGALDIIARFDGVRERKMVAEAAQNATLVAFTKYATELNEIQEDYARQKGHPPVSDSLPPIAGAVCWCREMLQRVTEPMVTFRDNKPIMKSVASLEVCKLHNQLSTALMQCDAFLLSRWQSAIGPAQAALQLPLLVQETPVREGGTVAHRVRVNFRKSLLDVIAESKALAEAGVELPEVVQQILTQEVRVKRFRQSLQQVLDNFYSTLDTLDSPLTSLLQPHTEALTRCLMPGCSSLTWSTLNIDAYLHQISSAVATFQTTVSQIQSTLQEHVYSVLQEIAKSSLYDIALASSQQWTPREFCDAMKSSAAERSSAVVEKVGQIRRAVLACVELASGREKEEKEDDMVGLKSDLVLAGVERREREVSVQESMKSTTQGTTTTNSGGGWKRGDGERWTVTQEEVGERGEVLLSHVCGLVFDAVTEMVARSHCQLSCGLRRGAERDAVPEPVTAKLSRSFVDLTGQRMVRFQDSQTVNNPRALLADMSHSEYSIPPLQLEAQIRLSVPRFHMEPRLSNIHASFFQLTSVILSLLRRLCWWAGPGAGREFLVMWDASGAVDLIHSEILDRFRSLEPVVDLAISSLCMHDFLWREDMHAAYQAFLQSHPTQTKCCRHIERFIGVEKELLRIPEVFVMGPLRLSAQPVVNSLSALTQAWKLKFASFLHSQAQSSLEAMVETRQRMRHILQQSVESLAQLRDILQLLLDIQDLQGSIDKQYSTVENLYSLLKRYMPSLPRSEVAAVETLRGEWEELVMLADSAHHRLLHVERYIHERETDKQVRELQVEMIRFRNKFDTEGPLVPGLTPHTAIERLESFTQQCEEIQSQRQLLCSVQSLLSLPVSCFPELDQTRDDLSYLHCLYSNYSKFLDFDQQFRQTLWQEVQLSQAEQILEQLWNNTSQLPPDQQEWTPTCQLRANICHYRDLLPLLARLHSPEVRSRHWLQVMRATNCTFQLEGSVFRLSHILDASLLMHEEEIDKILTCAVKELELENEYRNIEERWNEQVFQFAPYKDMGQVLLHREYTQSQCEALQEAGVKLATMLASDHVAHIRDEVIQWARRLSQIDDILTQWLVVQEQWGQLESVFASSHSLLMEEAVQFDAITNLWTHLMASAWALPGVVKWCEGCEDGRMGSLVRLRDKLELCKRSLSLYLLSKREKFPRLFFLTDDALLEILSSPVSSLTPHLPSLFTSTRSLVTSATPSAAANEDAPVMITGVESIEQERLNFTDPVAISDGVETWLPLLISSVQSSLSSLVAEAMASDEMPTTFPCQVGSLTLYLKWTTQTEEALSQCRYDKRALPGLRSKFASSVLGKLSHMLVRSRRRTGDTATAPWLQQKLEALASLAVWLRDILEDLCHQKIRTASDFEWQRYPRLYISEGSAHSSQPQIELRCLHMRLEYGYEFMGCRALPVLTPRMNNYIIAVMQGMESGLHSLVSGPRSSGKEEMIGGIAQLLGRFLFTYSCTAHSDTHTLSRITEGLAQSGGWGCLTDVHRLPRSVVGVVCHMIEAVSSALQDRHTLFRTLSGREAQLKTGMLVVLTSTGHTPWPLPPSLAPIFRTFRLPPLDPSLLLHATCSALGLRGPRQLACKLVSLHRMANDQLESGLPLSGLCQVLREVRSSQIKTAASHTHQNKSDHTVRGGGRNVEEHCSHRQLTRHTSVKEAHRGQKTISLVATPPSSQPLPPSAAREHIHIAQLVCALLAPRFKPQEQSVFQGMVKSAFALDDTTLSPPHFLVGVASWMATPTPGSDSPVHRVLPKIARKAGLIATETWTAKVKEILSIVELTKRHIVLAGRAASGKTAALSTAAETLNTLQSQGPKVEIHRVFPGAFDNVSSLIGRFLEGGAWADGVCVSLIRRGLATSMSSMWVCLDGDPSETWLHPLTELLSGSNVLCLPSGERVVGRASCGLRLVLETGNLHAATPASLGTCGVIFFGSDVLSWKPLVEVWLRSRHGNERACMRKQLPVFLDPVAKMVCGQEGQHSVVGLTKTCLAYLTSLLNTYGETAESFSEIHVIRLLVFSIIWSFGAVLKPGSERHEFGQLLKSLTNSLPDDDSQLSVFDYYVDESGEWDVWQSRLLPLATPPPVDLVGGVFVDTTDTVRVETLLDLALTARRHVLITGPHGAGKTSVCRHFLQARALSHVTSEGVCHLALDGHASSASLHHIMEVHMHHSQGSTYSPQDNKILHLLIDDLHLSQSTQREATPPSSHEYLRQLLDSGGVHTLGRPNTFSAIQRLSLFTTSTTFANSPSLCPRLLRHFAVISLPDLAGAPLTTILTHSLRALSAGRAGLGAESQTLSAVVENTAAVFLAVREALRQSDLPGRQHYAFSLTHIESAFQGLCYCLSSGSELGLGLSWWSEMTRSLVGPLCHSVDRHWLTSLIHSHAQKLPGELPESLPLCLTAIPTETKQGEEQPVPETTPINQLPKVELHPLCDWEDMEMPLSLFLMRCHQECGEFPLSLTANDMYYIVQLHRALKSPHGNCILCGPHGQQLHSLAKFSLYLAGYKLHPLDCSTPATFRSTLRALFRRAGLEGKPVAAILTERDVISIEVLQRLNSLFATGELPTLFSNDEMNGILQALAPSIKKDFASEETHPMHYFTARIARYLRLVICISPSSPLLTSQAHSFPGLLERCHLLWLTGWTDTELTNSLSHFFTANSLSLKKHIREAVYECMWRLHLLVLRQSGQLQLAGQFPSSCPTATGQVSTDEPSPSSFSVLMEGVVRTERELEGHNATSEFAGEFSLPYVGPLTFHRFLRIFHSLHCRKKSEAEREAVRLQQALQSLQRTEEEVVRMRERLATLEGERREVCREFEELLQELTQKSCQVERAKATLLQSGSVMIAIELTAKQEREMAESHEDEDDLLARLLGCALGRQGSRLELQLAAARERQTAVEEEEREAREAMIVARDEVQKYEERIDRNTVDQIKSLPSPPALVCTVMQIILTLLRENKGQERGGGGGRLGPEVSNDSFQSGSLASGSHHSGQPKPRRPSLHLSSSPRETRERWTAIKLALGDSQHFLDLITALNWREGLNIEAVNLIKSHLCVEQSGGERERMSVARSTAAVTQAAATHAAEVVGIMFGFAVSMVKYTALYQNHLLALEKLNRARQRSCELQQQLIETEAAQQKSCGEKRQASEPGELGELGEEEEVNEEGLRRLETELSELQMQFNQVAVKKHSLGKTCYQLAESLTSASHLMESFKSRQESWQHQLDHTPSDCLLATNCLLAAAITTYLGPYATLSRLKMVSTMREVCQETGLVTGAEEASQLLTLEHYPLFMMGQPAIHQLGLEGLPPDPTSQQTACIISCGHTHSCCLVCDPFSMAIRWLSLHFQRGEDPVIIEFESSGLHSVLMSTLSRGSTVIVTCVSGEGVCGDEVMRNILQASQESIPDSRKIKVEGKELEIHRDFRLLLVTHLLPGDVSSDLVAMTTVVLFWPEVSGIKELLLDQLLWQQNTKIAQERKQLFTEVHRQSLKMEETERKLLDLLAHDKCSHDNHQSSRELLQVNTSCNTAEESLVAAQSSLAKMATVQLVSLSSLASRAALVSFVAMATGTSLPLYATSYDHVASVFLSYLEQSRSHVQGPEPAEKLTQFIYHHLSRGMLERDRLLFAFTLVLQLELAHGVVSHHEISYLLRPSAGTEYAVRGLAAQAGLDLTGSTPFSLGKRPYDWILEPQWQAVLMVTSQFPWAQKKLKLAFAEEAQGLQANFRHIFQSRQPEIFITLGDKKIDERTVKDGGRNLIHIMLLNSAVRPDRLACSVEVISERVLLPPRSYYDMPVDIYKFHKTCSKGKVPLIIFHDDPHLPPTQIRALANKLHVSLSVLCVHGTGKAEVERVKSALALTSSNGDWLLLHNIQESEELVAAFPELLQSCPPGDGWRVWLSWHAGSVISLPVRLKNIVSRVVLESPTTLRSSVVHTLLSLPPDLLSASPRPEWLPLLHSCCLLHPLLSARREIHTLSWRTCPRFPHTILTDVLCYLKKVAETQCQTTTATGGYVPLSWSGLRHMLSEVFYGSLICNSVDLQTLTSIVEAWIHPGGPRRESDVYHIPKVFFVPGMRLSVLCQEVEQAMPPLVVTPELCGLHASLDIKIGHLSTLLPSLALLTSLLRQHAPPTDGDHAHQTHPLYRGRPDNYETRHLLTAPTAVVEKLPSWVHVPSQFVEWNIGGGHIPIPLEFGSNVQNVRLALEGTVRKIQEILPSGWTKTVVLECLAQHTHSLSMVHFMTGEAQQMTSALSVIRSSLSALLRTLSPHSHGDPHTLTNSPHLTLLTISLLSHKVPYLWVEAVGPTGPPQSWPLEAWVSDLMLRWAFLDQVLSVGVAKVPAYWLGAFFNPQGFLSILTQHVLGDKCRANGASEETHFLAEVTARNKDHVRDPAPEGELFVYGCYIWGCRVERSTTIEFQDLPPKNHSPTALPLLHLVLTTPDNQSATEAAPGGVAKGAESKTDAPYHCPVFASHARERGREIFHVLVQNPEVPPSRWGLRSISCTLRPF